jgi:uncharacterized membrane protein
VPETDATSSIPPVHIEETIQSIAGLNAEHHANGTRHQRVVDRITSLLGRASFIGTPTAFVVGWVSLNCFALRSATISCRASNWRSCRSSV